MKKIINILKILLLVIGIFALYGFSKARNGSRTLKGIDIVFTDANNPFITHETIRKLLLQQKNKDTLVLKDLDVSRMEQKLRENPMVRKADVFLTIDGRLGAKIEQRDPVGRVQLNNGESHYLDADGLQMPLSSVYAARVPLVNGIDEKDYPTMAALLVKIREDEFMRKMVIGVTKKTNGDIELDFRDTKLTALLGKPVAIEKKFQNFKAFHKKSRKDNTLEGYAAVNLKFNNQVIATKK